MGILKEGAKKAGLDLSLDGAEGNQFFGKVVKKQHELCYIGWGVGPPFPSYYQFFHSSNAREKIVHDESIFIPALKTDYVRVGYWNWLKFPNTKHYEFNDPKVRSPLESYVYWIDEEEKKNVLESKKNNEALPERNYIFDLYKQGLPTLEELDKREVKENLGE